MKFPHELEAEAKLLNLSCSCPTCVNHLWEEIVRVTGVEREVRTLPPDENFHSEVSFFSGSILRELGEVFSWIEEVISVASFPLGSEFVEQAGTVIKKFQQGFLGLCRANIYQVCLLGAEEALRQISLDRRWIDPQKMIPLVDRTENSFKRSFTGRCSQFLSSLHFIANSPERNTAFSRCDFLRQALFENLARLVRIEFERVYCQANFLQMRILEVRKVRFRQKNGCSDCLEKAEQGPYLLRKAPIPVINTHPFCTCSLEIEDLP